MSSGVFQNLALFIVDTLFSLYVLVLLIRSLLVIAQADYYNPLSQFIVRITEPPLFPLRRMVPPVGRVDLSCWLLAYAVKLGEIVLLMLIQGQSWPTSALVVVAAILYGWYPSDDVRLNLLYMHMYIAITCAYTLGSALSQEKASKQGQNTLFAVPAFPFMFKRQAQGHRGHA